MKTNVVTTDNVWMVQTVNMQTSFRDCTSAATQIGFLQQEIISLKADIEALKDEVEDCEEYDSDFDHFDSRMITEEDRDRDWDTPN